jgi:MarR family transcriptional regulator, transcriptional regulator for hemolysin
MLIREHSVGYMTNWAARLLIRSISPRLDVFGLTVGYLPVLFALSANPRLTQKSIVEEIGVEQPTMAATLSRMERDGLIARTPDPADGRSSLISLTAKARDLLPAVEKAVNETNAVATSGLTATERKQFFSIMGKIIAALAAE